VEFALVVPLFLLLVFGIVDFSRAFSVQAALADAAAEGTRTLAIGGTVAQGRAAADAILATAVWPVTVSYPVTVVCVPTATPGTTRASMTVSTAGYHFITPFIGSMFAPPTISGKAARQCAN
jgi:Flp pilus assembly protein TadG